MKLSNFFIILGFIIMLGGGVQILEILWGGHTNVVEGSKTSQMIYLSLYLVTFFGLILSRQIMPLGIATNFWFWLLLVWVFMSVFWTIDPEVTLRNVIGLFGTTLFAFYVVNCLDLQGYVKLLGISLYILNIASFFCILLFPEIGITPIGASEWRGVFFYKNALALTADLSIVIFCYLVITNKRGKWFWLIGILSSIILLIGSHSATGIIIFILVTLLIIFFYLTEKAPKLLWALFLGLTALLLLFSSSLPTIDEILAFFGKDSTLTGRTLLWRFSIDMALRKPLLGYGYGGFWLGSEGPSAWIPMGVNGNVLSAHNGFIEMFLTLGGIGLFLFIMVYGVAVKRATLLFVSKKFSFQYSIYLLILIFMLSYNLSENTFLVRNNFFWVLFSSVIFYQSKRELLISAKYSQYLNSTSYL